MTILQRYAIQPQIRVKVSKTNRPSTLLIPAIIFLGILQTAVQGFVHPSPSSLSHSTKAAPNHPLFFNTPATTTTTHRIRRDSLKLFAKKAKKPKSNTITVNRIAYRNYEVLEQLEAGISLVGTEVKSIREGKMNMRDGYVKPSKDGRGCTLHNVHISKHRLTSEYFQHEEKRVRNLLVHKEEARKLLQKTERTGMTIIPLRAYFDSRNKVKIVIGLCRGKNVRDKRQDIKERESKRDTNRMMKNFGV